MEPNGDASHAFHHPSLTGRVLAVVIDYPLRLVDGLRQCPMCEQWCRMDSRATYCSPARSRATPISSPSSDAALTGIRVARAGQSYSALRRLEAVRHARSSRLLQLRTRRR
jgi:hypothetical protein